VDNRTDDRTFCIYQIFHGLLLRRFIDLLGKKEIIHYDSNLFLNRCRFFLDFFCSDIAQFLYHRIFFVANSSIEAWDFEIFWCFFFCQFVLLLALHLSFPSCDLLPCYDWQWLNIASGLIAHILYSCLFLFINQIITLLF